MPKYSKEFKLKIVLEHQNEKIGWRRLKKNMVLQGHQ